MSSTLPQTSRNREIAEKVDALLREAEKLGCPRHLLTRRQARKALQKRGGLLASLRSIRITKDWSKFAIDVRQGKS